MLSRLTYLVIYLVEWSQKKIGRHLLVHQPHQFRVQSPAASFTPANTAQLIHLTTLLFPSSSFSSSTPISSVVPGYELVARFSLPRTLLATILALQLHPTDAPLRLDTALPIVNAFQSS